MARAYTLSNGSLLVGIDDRGQVRDVYYPHVGLENHVSGRVHRVGVHVDGMLAWLDEPSWDVQAIASSDTLGGTVTARNGQLQVDLVMRDIVYNEKDIFLREVTVTNKAPYERAVRVFFGHEFRMWEMIRGDTAYYDPRNGALVHYKGRRIFMMRAESDEVFDQYSIGIFGIEGKEGTFRDAEDGELSGNAIEHGSVDSMMRSSLILAPGETKIIHYWMCAGRFMEEVRELGQYVRQKTPAYLIHTATDYWRAWLSTQGISFAGLPTPIVDLFNRSLLVIRAHADKDGAFIASSDTGILNQGRDTYAYAWPRDGAYTARAITLAGDVAIARQFFKFCLQTITSEGYFMHKYLPDGSIGSSWHPWIRAGKPQLPIQEDETAIILVALRDYYAISRDIEGIEEMFNPLIKKAADFLVWYRDLKTGLPQPSYDLWEEQYGVHTYTCSITYAALLSASYFAKLLGKVELAEKYHKAAEEIKEGILKHLYNPATGTFYKFIYEEGDVWKTQPMLDMSSVYGVFAYGVLPSDDPRLVSAMRAIEQTLLPSNSIGGIPRNENDYYYRASPSDPSNPWIITTLWRAQYYLAQAKNEADLAVVRDILEWVVQHATPSGMLSEQLHPRHGAPIGATPLVWSHAEFVTTVIEYLQKLDDLGLCKTCYPLRRAPAYE